MPKITVLKPLEVVSRLQALGFNEVRQRRAHSSSAIPMVGAPRCRFTRAGTSIRCCCGRIARDIGITAEELAGVDG